VVDDDPDMIYTIKKVLEDQYDITGVDDGEKFLDLIKKEKNPDAIIMDVMMPGATTNEILEQLKRLNCDPKIMLLTTVRFYKDDVKKLVDVGNIVEYVKKPFEMDDLIDVVKNHI
jgi:CheY-like chemotaxis protein